MHTFVVKTQHLENYGAHCEDGRYASGNAYWKFKGGDDYIVEDVERGADAMAFVMAKYSENNLSFKVIPTEVLLIDQWVDELNKLDEDYREFLYDKAIRVSPKDLAA
jgi:hypothetical protein